MPRRRSPLTGSPSITRPVGQLTRGTTGHNRLRRCDRWLVHSPRVRTALQSATDPLVVDLGYGALPVTTLELASRLRTVRTDVRVIGLEIDPERVQTARAAKTDTVEFGLGGFELAGLRPVLVRAFNVLRQYPVDAVDEAWSLMRARLAPGGLIVDGTCDELGRRCGWVLLDGQGPVSLTLACDPFAIEQPVRPGRATAENPYPPECLGSADQHAADRRRPRMGQASPVTACSARGNAGAQC